MGIEAYDPVRRTRDMACLSRNRSDRSGVHPTALSDVHHQANQSDGSEDENIPVERLQSHGCFSRPEGPEHGEEDVRESDGVDDGTHALA